MSKRSTLQLGNPCEESSLLDCSLCEETVPSENKTQCLGTCISARRDDKRCRRMVTNNPTNNGFCHAHSNQYTVKGSLENTPTTNLSMFMDSRDIMNLSTTNTLIRKNIMKTVGKTIQDAVNKVKSIRWRTSKLKTILDTKTLPIQGLDFNSFVLNVTHINIDSRVGNLDFIELFTNIKNITMSNNDRREVDSISKLRNVTHLLLVECTELTKLPHLPILKALHAVSCISLRDISVLRTMKHLEHLNLSGCYKIDDIEPIRYLVNLRHLNLSYCNNIMTINPLASIPQLRRLYLVNCDDEIDMNPLVDIQNLNLLDISGMRFTDDISNVLKKLHGLSYLFWLDSVIENDDLHEIQAHLNDTHIIMEEDEAREILNYTIGNMESNTTMVSKIYDSV